MIRRRARRPSAALAVGLAGVGARQRARAARRAAGRSSQHGDDQQAHLEAPVAEVGVAQHLVAAEAVEPLDRLADDRGAQVADVHLLGDVGAAVVDQHPARRRDRAGAGARIGGDRVGARRERRVADPQVDEARAGDLDRWPAARSPASALGHGGGDLARVAPGGLGRRQRAVALEVGQVRPVGGRHAAQARAAGRAPAKAAPTASPSAGPADRSLPRGGRSTWAAVWPALARKRLPWRLKSAICGRHVEADQDLEVGAADLGCRRAG